MLEKIIYSYYKLGDYMSRCKYTSSEVSLLARLMRSEAVGEGRFGMKLVGNVVINRVVAKCLNFRKVNNITQVIYQKGQFAGISGKLFYGNATSVERRLALDTITFWRAYPAYAALFYQNPGRGKACRNRFWGTYAGKFKNHCFYNADASAKCRL